MMAAPSPVAAAIRARRRSIRSGLSFKSARKMRGCAHAPRSGAARERQMASVLVVDDETHVRQVLGRIIREAGHEVMEAESSDAALKVMAERAADVMFTDIQMPG